nr:reverse transcriptase domain-containing protein [Tanacetum cinerariifolium]
MAGKGCALHHWVYDVLSSIPEFTLVKTDSICIDLVSIGITTRSGVAYQGPTIPTPSKQGTEVTKDQVQNPSSQSSAPVQPLVSQSETLTPIFEPVVALVSAPMPNMKSSIHYPSRRDNERRRDQANEQIEKFYEIFKDMSFKISFMDALILMPKFSSTLKALIRNKEKLNEMARTLMNEHCSVIILNKLPRNLETSTNFLFLEVTVPKWSESIRRCGNNWIIMRSGIATRGIGALTGATTGSKIRVRVSDWETKGWTGLVMILLGSDPDPEDEAALELTILDIMSVKLAI